MPIPNRKAVAGLPLRSLPASTWNELVEMLQWYKGRHRTGGRPQTETRDGGIIEVENTNGVGVAQFSVLGLYEPRFKPSENLDAFKQRRLVMKGRSPIVDPFGDQGKFCVTLEPIAAGKVGLAVYTGFVQCRLDIDDENIDYPFAECTNGEATKLRAAWSGSAKILSKEFVDETWWGVVELTGRSHRLIRAARWDGEETWQKDTTATVLECDDDHSPTGHELTAWNYVTDIEPGSKPLWLMGVDRKLEVIVADPCSEE